MRQEVIITHNPNEIDENQLLLMRFPNLGSDDMIIPGMTNLSFNIELSSTADRNRMLVSNVGRAIMKQFTWQLSSKGMRYWVWTISMSLCVTKTCGKQSLKSRMQ